MYVVVSLELPDVGLSWVRMEHPEEHVDGCLLVRICWGYTVQPPNNEHSFFNKKTSK